jgi:hypothetical protein
MLRNRITGLVNSVWGAIQIGAIMVLSPLLRMWYNRWGATDEEVAGRMPGDEWVAQPQLDSTRAISIRARPSEVWPWLVQIGAERGGFYSYDGLENLAGCRIRSADRILEAFQSLEVGQLVRLGPPGYPCYVVVEVVRARTLVLRGADPATGQLPEPDPQPTKYANSTWQWVLAEGKDGVTRLIARQRLAYSRDMALVWRLTEPVSYVMERRMLRGIRLRAEKSAG